MTAVVIAIWGVSVTPYGAFVVGALIAGAFIAGAIIGIVAGARSNCRRSTYRRNIIVVRVNFAGAFVEEHFVAEQLSPSAEKMLSEQ